MLYIDFYDKSTFKTLVDSKGLKIFIYEVHPFLVVSANKSKRDLLRSTGTLS